MQIKNMSLSFGIHQIFKDVNLSFDEHSKIGVVGVNGAGKSTFFKLLTGKLETDSGKIILKNNEKIVLLDQEINDSNYDINMTVFDFLLSGRPIEKLESELNDCYTKISEETNESKRNFLFNKIEKIQNKLEYYEYTSCETLLLKIIDGMHISDDILYRSLKELSGGQKSKVAFARILYSKPEIILLDEPTNHLDNETKDYVINFLKNYKGSVFVISHDISFLNLITNKTLFIDKENKTIEMYNGNYDEFIKVYDEKKSSLLDKALKQEEEIEKLQNIVNKYKTSSGKRKRMAMDREKKLNKLLEEKIDLPRTIKNTKFETNIEIESNKTPLIVNNLCFGYTNKLIINDLSFSLNRGEKFLIIGENGVGKSTLLKLIYGKIKEKSGEIKYNKNTIISYYAQEHELLDNDMSILDNFKNENISLNNIRNILGRFLFYGDDVYKKINVLSPGEKSRVALAKIAISKANLLLLDEPTNHLDVQTKEIIAKAFKDYKGTIVLVSHDFEFIKHLNIDRILILPKGEITHYTDEKVIYYEKINNKQNVN